MSGGLRDGRRHSIAVIGCGYWGKNHVRTMHELGVELSICDSDESRLRSLQEQFPTVGATQDFREILADTDIDAVVLATPSSTHFSLGREILLAGKDLLVEKPMALDYEQAVQLVDLSRETSRILMVGHVMRYHPAIVKLKELIERGELGRIRYIYSNRLSMGRVRREENALWSFAPHDISIVLYLTGSMPLQVSATGGTYLQSAVADVSLSSLEFENGVRSHIFVSWLHPFKEQRLVLVGTRQMAVFDNSAATGQLALFDQEIDLVDGEFVTEVPARRPVPLDAVEPLLVEASHFLDCVTNRDTPMTDGAEGARVLAVLQACQESLERGGEPVALPVAASGAV